MPKRYSCVLFDVDGTLADTSPVIREALRECGCPNADSISDEEIRCGSPPKILQGKGCGHLADKFWRVYETMLSGRVSLLDGQAAEVLHALEERKVLLGVVTSCRLPTTRAVLRLCGILHFFERCMITYGSCSRRKPHPDPILLALKSLGTEAASSLYVGDSEKDAAASHAAGVDFGLPAWAGLTDDAVKVLMPDVVLARIADLLDHT